ncbi:hypothetical protein [Silvimonas sp.]|uniref:hypothetical protein n=1 Tax=Silvimonas sp. TaxID=2650811 RepID=UPI00283F6287|nr:hypothetical protein [Silvimonas sp.]MDR3426090.1 hypothetical protein [Silvimonas sp.]
MVTVQVHDAAGTKQSVVFFNDDARVAAEWKVGEVREFKGIAVTARGDADMRFPIYGKFNMKFTSRLVDGATARCIR